MLQIFRTLLISKDIQFALLVKELPQFCLMGAYCLLVELHWCMICYQRGYPVQFKIKVNCHQPPLYAASADMNVPVGLVMRLREVSD